MFYNFTIARALPRQRLRPIIWSHGLAETTTTFPKAKARNSSDGARRHHTFEGERNIRNGRVVGKSRREDDWSIIVPEISRSWSARAIAQDKLSNVFREGRVCSKPRESTEAITERASKRDPS